MNRPDTTAPPPPDTAIPPWAARPAPYTTSGTFATYYVRDIHGREHIVSLAILGLTNGQVAEELRAQGRVFEEPTS